MRIYKYIRSNLSSKNQGRLSKAVYLLGLKPSINSASKSNFKKGIVTFSADFEMAWAFRYSKKRGKIAEILGLKERENIPVLLNLLDTYNIPVSWATVGHLMLNECKIDLAAGLPHSEMPRPGYFENRNWKFTSGDWYQHDPCKYMESAPAWYASDLVDRILSSRAGHELACHTFSHIDFSYKNCSSELAEAEINTCIKLASKLGVNLRSMVFPGGTFGNFEILARKGFTCYRKPMKYHLDLPTVDGHGLIAIPSSLGLDRDPYGWSKEFHLDVLRRFIQKAAKYKLVCHFWFHPSLNKWYLENVFPDLLEMVSEARERQEIEVYTMAQLSEKVLSTLS